ncbi:MAG TPA: glycoside hydrolase family 15 protein [Terriglobia bacterium]|nr:glycoside hydrolase family 15 protein [Terriglobia bacterium]
MARRIEDYGLIGDLHTAALVGKDGSIDWLCWPRFDSSACFAALLGNEEHGRWLLAPRTKPASITRRYLGQTLILETLFESASGTVSVIDFMPLRNHLADIVRLVICRSGTVDMEMDLVLRFDYGVTVPWVEKLEDGTGLTAIAGPHRVVLRSPVPTEGRDFHTFAHFQLSAGERAAFSLTYTQSHVPLPAATDIEAAFAATQSFWEDWAACSSYRGPWQQIVTRSLITLKALTYLPTGGIIAAPTTSLPEWIGGIRNWDYRYCWIRDATLALLALMHTGYYQEADAWRSWLLRAVAGNPAQIQIMYGIAGERWVPELELGWLPGYDDSVPVRVGNAAAEQRQLDIFGEMMDALYQGRQGELAASDTAWALQTALINHLEKIWQEADDGIWESRGGRRHYTFSKMMVWVALDRAIRTAQEAATPCPLDRWIALRDRVHDEVCQRGFNTTINSFVRVYDTAELDAALLLLPLVGFLPAEDPRVIGTVEAIQRHLMRDGFVLRYDTKQAEDGLPAGEGVFLACSFWLADNLVLQGKLQEARALFERLLALCNDVGLLSEEYDPAAGRLLGNFPQAFSHIALVNTALNLTRAIGPAKQRSSPETGSGSN